MSRQQRITKQRRNRAFRVRRRVRGTEARPRITVHRTLKHIYVQVIDDDTGRTLCEANSRQLGLAYGGNVDAAKQVGAEIGRRAKEAGVEALSFDRGSFRYHGRIKALANAVREAGIKF